MRLCGHRCEVAAGAVAADPDRGRIAAEPLGVGERPAGRGDRVVRRRRERVLGSEAVLDAEHRDPGAGADHAALAVIARDVADREPAAVEEDERRHRPLHALGDVEASGQRSRAAVDLEVLGGGDLGSGDERGGHRGQPGEGLAASAGDPADIGGSMLTCCRSGSRAGSSGTSADRLVEGPVGDHGPGLDPRLGDEPGLAVGIGGDERLDLGPVPLEDEQGAGGWIAGGTRDHEPTLVAPASHVLEVGLAVWLAPLEDVVDVGVGEDVQGGHRRRIMPGGSGGTSGAG